MENEDFTLSLAPVFSLWLLRLNNCLGTLPVSATRHGLRFSWLSALRSLVAAMFACYMFIVNDLGEHQFPNESEKTLAKKFSIRRMTTAVNLILFQIGAIVSLSISGVRCYLKHFDSIVGHLLEFETCWQKSVCKNTLQENSDSVNAVSIGLLLYAFSFYIPFLNYERYVNVKGPYSVAATGMCVYFETCKMFLMMYLLTFLRIAKSLTKAFKRLNSVVKYCLVNEPEDRRVCSVFTLTALNEGT